MALSAATIDLIGWVPGIIFPGASLLQLRAVIKAPTVDGISISTWLLFVVANICAYIYLGKYWAPQALAYLSAALVQIAIATVVFRKRRAAKNLLRTQ